MDSAEEFEDNEIELMGNMFTTFGGYYGKISRLNERFREKLKEVMHGYITQGKDLIKVENNIQVLHQIIK
ncbi:hypothetical protein ES707_04693 [subsurface metagenome]